MQYAWKIGEALGERPRLQPERCKCEELITIPWLLFGRGCDADVE
jgi:hypothetical protein